MSDYREVLESSMTNKIGEFIVTDRSGKILFRTNSEEFSDDQWLSWAAFNIDTKSMTAEERWEISDRRAGKYYSVISVPTVKDGDDIITHHIFNTSEYAELLRDVSGYLKDWKDLSAFQSAMLELLSGIATDCLPLILKTFKLNSIALFVGHENAIDLFTLKKGVKEVKHEWSDWEGAFDAERGDRISLPFDAREWLCYLNDKAINGVNYALYLQSKDRLSDEAYHMYYNVIRLFLENSILRESIIYASEHDQLTRLSNKGKYMSMMEDFFPNCKSIAVYNMDVNYLKRTNDTMGHEAGDALIVKSARSLLKVERENVRGFRMGGDEFMLIAWDLSEEEAEDIRDDWNKALKELNDEGGLECVIACGLAYGSGDYDLKELLKLADDRMYENKVAIKKSRGEDPNAR